MLPRRYSVPFKPTLSYRDYPDRYLIEVIGISRAAMNFSQSTDDRLLAYYESIRLQIARSSEQHRSDPSVKQFAERVKAELDRRRLKVTPIEWHHPSDHN
jgi:hypothetical protein